MSPRTERGLFLVACEVRRRSAVYVNRKGSVQGATRTLPSLCTDLLVAPVSVDIPGGRGRHGYDRSGSRTVEWNGTRKEDGRRHTQDLGDRGLQPRRRECLSVPTPTTSVTELVEGPCV